MSQGLSDFWNLFISQCGFVILMLMVSIIIDFLTGMLKSKISGTVNSNAGYIGLWKKISLLAAILFGLFLDVIEYYLLSKLSGEVSIQIPFSLFIGIYILLNESISIYENLNACGVKFPKSIIKVLNKLFNSLNKTKIGKK